MNKITFIAIWILLSYPIAHRVNKNLEKNNDKERYEIGFQIFLFFRALIEVPRFYLLTFLHLITPKHK